MALDAVPFDAAVTAFSASASTFERYLQPIPVVSAFPSTTTLAFTGMFEGVGLATPPGYEARFYDWEKGRVRGGGVVSYGKIEFSWREFFDWKTEGALRKAVGYSRPLAFSRAEFRRGIQAFLDSSHPSFYMYVGATDGVAHLAGPEAFVEVLADLAAVLDEARVHEPDFVTLMFSDHGVGGGEPLKNVRKAVVRAARESGFALGGRVRSDNDLVLVPFGLLSELRGFHQRGRGGESCSLAGLCGGGFSFVPRVRLLQERAWPSASTSRRAAARRRSNLRRMRRRPIDFGTIPSKAEILWSLPRFFDSLGDSEGWVSDRRLLRETAAHRFPRSGPPCSPRL